MEEKSLKQTGVNALMVQSYTARLLALGFASTIPGIPGSSIVKEVSNSFPKLASMFAKEANP